MIFYLFVCFRSPIFLEILENLEHGALVAFGIFSVL